MFVRRAGKFLKWVAREVKSCQFFLRFSYIPRRQVDFYEMRLPKHKYLKKEASKHTRQVKHSPKKLAKLDRQSSRGQEEMVVVENEVATNLETEERKQLAVANWQEKLKRKKANAHKVSYKKINSSISHFNGPRAVSK